MPVTLACLAALALAPSAASAKQVRLFAGTFGAATNPAPYPANPYPLPEGVRGVAVDNSPGGEGDLYVAAKDESAAEVEKFDSGGHFLLMFGLNVNKTAVEESRPLSERNRCPVEPGDQCQPGESHFPQQSAIEEPIFIAVDNSAGPSHGDIYVAGPNSFTPVIEKFDSSGQLVESWGDTTPTPDGQLRGSDVIAPPAPVSGPFGIMGGIVVDHLGDLWVDAGDEMFEFDQSAAFLSGWQPARAGDGIAVDSEGNFFLSGSGFAEEFDSAGRLIGVVAPSEAEIKAHGGVEHAFRALALTVDPLTGDLFVAGRESSPELGMVKRYDSSCEPVITNEAPEPGCAPAETFGGGLISAFPGGLAIDPSTEALYVGDHGHVTVFSFLTVPDAVTTKPTNPTHTSATLTGTVNPAGIELNPGTQGCRFEWGETTAYGHVAACETAGGGPIGSGSAPVKVKANITGLEAGKTYHYRLLASNHNDENETVHQPEAGADLAFGPPLLESTSATGVAATSATLQAEVNPQDLDTRVRFEYVTQSQFEASGFSEPFATAEIDLGSAGSPQSVTSDLSGLAPATTYRYRAVAENVLGEGPEAVIGPGLAFTTQVPGPLALPDSRQWQLASPARKLGARIEPISETGVIEAAADGSGITYLASTPTSAEPQGYTGLEQMLSTRGASAWSTRDIGIPHAGATGISLGSVVEYKFFNPDLTLGAVQPFGPFDPGLSPEASESTAFLHDLSGACGSSCFRPLVTGKPGFENVPAGTHFGQDELCERHVGEGAQVICGPQLLGASEDLAHVVLRSTAPLKQGAGEKQLYEWSGGVLSQVSELPGGGSAEAEARLGQQDETARSAISADGSRAVFEAEPNLYLRDTTLGQTIQLDHAESCTKCSSGGGRFQIASADGSRIFFTDTHRLAADSGANPASGKQKADLYECRITIEAGEPNCALTDLTPKQGEEGADVQGRPLGASEDGSNLYFVAKGVQSEEENSRGLKATSGQPNLYLRRAGTTHFITTFTEGDGNDWSEGVLGQPTRVSSNGRFLALMSEASLTGYDNRDVATGKPVAEVYLYDAATNRLRCASCDPSGARPHGVEYFKLEPGSGGLVGGPRGIWPVTSLVAANVPGTTAMALGKFRYQPRYLSNSGRLFFNANDGLVPADSNGTEDVYQYEPPGVGGCSESSPTFSAASGGCVDLISSGTSGEESAFLDASESGDDVFFLTASKLVAQDEDSALDVYDAHACPPGAAVPCLPEPPPPAPLCQGDACQQPAVPPADQTPGSLTFQGAGNVLQCPKGKQLKQGKCVKQKAKKPKKGKKKTGKGKAQKKASRTATHNHAGHR